MLLEIPHELLEHIVSYCSVSDLKILSCCSRQYKEAVKEFLWYAISIPFHHLLENDFSDDKRIGHLQFANVIHLGVRPSASVNERFMPRDVPVRPSGGLVLDGGRINPAYLSNEDVKEKLLANYNIVFEQCNPKILHTCFVPNTAFTFDKLAELFLYRYIGDNITFGAIYDCLVERHLLNVIDGGNTDERSSLDGLVKLKVFTVSDCLLSTDADLRASHIGIHWETGGDLITNMGLLYINDLVTLKELSLSGCLKITDIGFSNVSTLGKLEKLNVSACSNITDMSLSHIGALVTLKELSINGCFRITDNGLNNLHSLVKLEKLGVCVCGLITDVGLAHIGSLVTLKDLNISGCSGITDVGLSYLCNLTKLEKINVSNCEFITDLGLSYIGYLVELKELNISRCSGITDIGLNHLRHLLRLEKFNISDSGRELITDAGLAHIGALATLKELGINGCFGITDVGFNNLRSLVNLGILSVTFCLHITDVGLSHISSLVTLRELNISLCSAITDVGLNYLRSLVNLEKLNVMCCVQITDAGLLHISALVTLKKLNISRCSEITNNGLKYLRSLVNLEKVDLSGCTQITDVGHLSDISTLQVIRRQNEPQRARYRPMRFLGYLNRRQHVLNH